MGSLDIFIENINRLAKHHELNTYKDIANFLNVSEDSLKQWKSKTRCPSLKTLDRIGDTIKCKTYSLIQKEGDLFIEIEHINNNSRKILLDNLKKYFLEFGRFSWSDKAALFYGFVSEDALKSYFRNDNYKTPPLKKIDEMAEAIGKPAYELIKEERENAKADK